MRNHCFSFLACAAVAFAFSSGFAQELRDQQAATSCLDWRTPALEKKPRLLFLAKSGEGVGDAAELKQRFNIEPLCFSGKFETFLAKNPDVFVFTSFAWNDVPARFRDEIVRRVRDEGNGLVFFGGRPGNLVDKLPKDMVAAQVFETRIPRDGKQAPDFYLVGKGRIVCAPAYAAGSGSPAPRGNCETRAAQQMSPILWAAHVNEGIVIRFACGAAVETVAAEAEFLSFTTRKTGGGAAKVAWRVRNASAEVVLEGKAKTNGSCVAVPVKHLPPGEYVLDVLDTLPITHPFTRLGLANAGCPEVAPYRAASEGGAAGAAHAAGASGSVRDASASVTLSIDTAKTGLAVPKTLWGGFFEDYDFGADGGLYPELVANRGFDLKRAPKYGWIDDCRGTEARISIQHGRPVHPNTAAHIRIERVAAKPGARAGVKNLGYFGIAVEKGKKYDLSLYLRGLDAYAGAVEVLLEAKGETLAKASFPAGAFKVGAKRTGLDYELPDWTKVSAVFVPNATAADATLAVLATDRGAIEADMVSLYPQDTYRGRKNGLRRDLAEKLEALQPAFLRFPGGCMLEGCDYQQWCDWKRTVGPLERRECVEGLWSWIATHGLGYYEYFLMCEDMKMEPLPVLIGGVSCQFRGSHWWPEEGMGDLVKNTLDLIEFANGDASTTWGAVRASMGHPAPFNMKMLALGNENWGEGYLKRYDILEKAVKAKYPEMQLVPSYGAGVDNDGWRTAKAHFKGRHDLIADEHYYMPADWFFRNADRYDAYDRKDPRIFVGEYASFDNVKQNGRTRSRCCLENALGEAAMLTGYERNCDVVVMAAFAPMYMRWVKDTQEFFEERTYSSAWPGSMIWFDGLRSFGRTSYWVQKLFATNRPDVLVPFTQNVPRSRAGVYAACGLDRAKGELIVKVVTAGGERPLALDFASALPAGTVRVTTLASPDLYAENTFEEPFKVAPKESEIAFAGGKRLDCTLAAHSLTVLRITSGRGTDR